MGNVIFVFSSLQSPCTTVLWGDKIVASVRTLTQSTAVCGVQSRTRASMRSCVILTGKGPKILTIFSAPTPRSLM